MRLRAAANEAALIPNASVATLKFIKAQATIKLQRRQDGISKFEGPRTGLLRVRHILEAVTRVLGMPLNHPNNIA